MKSIAPSFVASIAVSMVACPDIMITGKFIAFSFDHFFNKEIPSTSGIHISKKTRSGILFLILISASIADSAISVEYPSSIRIS